MASTVEADAMFAGFGFKIDETNNMVESRLESTTQTSMKFNNLVDLDFFY